MKSHCLHWFSCGFLFAASLSCARAQIPWATEPFSRQNRADFYGVGQYLHQEDTEFAYGAFKLKLDDTGLGGIGGAFHFNDYISLRGELLLGPATFREEFPGGPTVNLGKDGYIQSGRLNVEYNIINRRLTPFLNAGIGYQYISVDNYNDFYYYSHYYSETDFTWNVGGGLRWNVTDHFFIKAAGGAQWLKYDGADDITTQIEASFTIGTTFP